MFDYSKECFKKGYTIEEYKEMLKYLQEVARNIVEIHLKKNEFGLYKDIELLKSLFPELEEKEEKQLMIELKKIGVETYDNSKLFRY